MSEQLTPERFSQLLKRRAEAEAELESTFASAIRRLWPRYCELCGISYPDEDSISFDAQSPEIAAVTVWVRGDYTSFEFPMRYLWSSNWEEDVRTDLLREAEERGQTRSQAEQEQHERETYERLRRKFEGERSCNS